MSRSALESELQATAPDPRHQNHVENILHSFADASFADSFVSDTGCDPRLIQHVAAMNRQPANSNQPLNTLVQDDNWTDLPPLADLSDDETDDNVSLPDLVSDDESIYVSVNGSHSNRYHGHHIVARKIAHVEQSPAQRLLIAVAWRNVLIGFERSQVPNNTYSTGHYRITRNTRPPRLPPVTLRQGWIEFLGQSSRPLMFYHDGISAPNISSAVYSDDDKIMRSQTYIGLYRDMLRNQEVRDQLINELRPIATSIPVVASVPTHKLINQGCQHKVL
jgi:hypothetical protein